MPAQTTRPGSSTLVTRVFVTACVVFYVFAVFIPGLRAVAVAEEYDFASYYYGLRAALDGEDPYDPSGLSARALADGGAGPVHPFFYPPPSLVFFLPSAPFGLRASTIGMYLLNHLALAGAGGLLWLLLERGRDRLPLLAFMLATFGPVAVNNRWGQVNLWVLLLILSGLLLLRSGREAGAGALLGAAAMLKISPALFVVWLAWRRCWRGVAGAAAAALLLTLASLPLVGPSHQVHFYTKVLPAFRAGGDYSGLGISLRSVGIHSVPRLWHLLYPNPDSRSVLSGAAAAASTLTAIALVAGVALALPRRGDDPSRDRDRLAPEAGAVAVLMVILPVFAYDHHLVFLLPALAALWGAISSGVLARSWLAALAPAYAALAVPKETHKAIYDLTEAVPAPFGAPLRGLVLEGKLLAALVVLAACVVACRRFRSSTPVRT